MTAVAGGVWLRVVAAEALTLAVVLLTLGAWHLDASFQAEAQTSQSPEARWEASYSAPPFAAPLPGTTGVSLASTRPVFRVERPTIARERPALGAEAVGCVGGGQVVDDDGGHVTGWRAVHGYGWSGWVSVADVTGPWRGPLLQRPAALGCS